MVTTAADVMAPTKISICHHVAEALKACSAIQKEMASPIATTSRRALSQEWSRHDGWTSSGLEKLTATVGWLSCVVMLSPPS